MPRLPVLDVVCQQPLRVGDEGSVAREEHLGPQITYPLEAGDVSTHVALARRHQDGTNSRTVVPGHHTWLPDQTDLSGTVPRTLDYIPADTSARSLEHERVTLAEHAVSVTGGN